MAGFYYTLTLADQFSQTFDKWDKGIQQAVNNTKTAAERMEGLVGKAAIGMGAAMMLAIPAMAASFIPLDQAMARLETVSTASFGTLDQAMRDSLESARAWSSQHIQSTTDVVNAQFEMATAGLKNREALIGVAAAAQLATATGDGLAESARFLASLFNTFGQTLQSQKEGPAEFFQKTNDALAEVIKRFQVTMVPLRQGFAYVTAQAVELGLSVSEVAVSLGILNTAGLRGSAAGAALQNVFMRMDEAVKKLGVDTEAYTDKFGQFTSIADFVDEVSNRLSKQGTALDQLNAANDTFGIRAAKGILLLIQHREALRSTTEQIDRSSGAAKKMADIIERTTGSQLKIAMNDAQNFAQVVGESLAPALISFMKVAQSFFGAVGSWAKDLGIMAPVIIGITGAVVAGVGAWNVYNAVLTVTGAKAVSMGAAFTAVGGALLRITLIGAAVFTALTLISNAMKREQLTGKFVDISATDFQPVVEGIRNIAVEAYKVDRQIAGLKNLKGLIEPGNIPLQSRMGFPGTPMTNNPDGSISTVRSMGVEMDGQHILLPSISELVPSHVMDQMEAIKEFVRTGHHLGKFMSDEDAAAAGEAIHEALANAMDLGGEALGERFHDRISGSIRGLGLDVQFSEQVASAVDKSIVEMRRLGVGWGDSMTAGANAVSQIVSAVGVDSSMTELLDRFTVSTNRFKAATLSLGESKTALEAFRNLMNASQNSVSNSNPLGRIMGARPEWFDELKRVFLGSQGNPLGDLGKKWALEFISNMVSTMETFNAAGVLDGFKKSFPEEFKAAIASMKEFGFDKIPNLSEGASAAAMAASIAFVETFQKGVAEKLKVPLATAGAYTKGLGLAGEAGGLGQAFLKSQGAFEDFRKIFEKGIDPSRIEGLRNAAAGMAEDAGKIADIVPRATEALNEFLDKIPKTPEFAGLRKDAEGLIEQITRLQSETESGAAAATKYADEMGRLATVFGDIGATHEGIKEGVKGITDAMTGALLIGDFAGFEQKLFESAFKSMEKGVTEGAAEGFLAASGMEAMFETDKIKEKMKAAVSGATVGGHIDIGKMLEGAQDLLPKSGVADNFKEAWMAMGDSVRAQIQTFAEGNGTVGQFFQTILDGTEKASDGMKKQIESISELRVSMLSASTEQKFYLQELIALKERSGTVRGVDLGTSDIRAQIELVSGMFKDAMDRFGKSSAITSGIGDVLKDLFTKLQQGESLDKKFGFKDSADQIDRMEKGANSLTKALNTPLGIKGETALVADNLERAETAAVGILDALEKVRAGNVLPSTVNVSGGGGGTGGPVTITLGGIQIIMDVGAAITQDDLNKLRERLDKEWEQKRDAILTEVRSRK